MSSSSSSIVSSAMEDVVIQIPRKDIVMKNASKNPYDEIVVCNDPSPTRTEIAKEELVRHWSNLGVGGSQNEGSRMLKSGLPTLQGSEIHEDYSFLDDDFSNEYKRMNFSPLSMIQLLTLILVLGGFVCTLVIKVLRKFTIFDLELWKVEMIVLVVLCGRLVSGWVVRIAVFFIARKFPWRRRVLYFVYCLKNYFQTCLWFSLMLVAWEYICYKRVEKITHGKVLYYVTKICISLVLGQFIWLLKTVLVKSLVMTFHVDTFFNRIHESLFTQYVIERLIGKNEEKDNADSWITSDNWHRYNQKNISPWNMKKLMKIVPQCVLSNFLKQLQESAAEDEGEVHITTENQAKTVAEKIFNKVSKPGYEFIFLEDLMRFMRENEALNTIRLFDGDESKGISKSKLQNLVVNLCRERRDLASSLNDTKITVNKVKRMLNVISALAIVVISLLILGIAKTHFFIFLCSQILLVVFIFGNTCKTIFEAIIFLFVMHPFDIGDRVEIDGVQMVVKEMHILTTVFLRFDNQKIIYPNNVLATKPISNERRSPNMGDAIEFFIHIRTPTETIAKMKERITRYVDGKSGHWHPAPMIIMKGVEDLNRIKCSVLVSHTMNFQDMDERWIRRANLVEEMANIFKELDIEYRL